MLRMDQLRKTAKNRFDKAQYIEKSDSFVSALPEYEAAIKILEQIPTTKRTTSDLRELDAYHWEAACVYRMLSRKRDEIQHTNQALGYLMQIKSAKGYHRTDNDTYFEALYRYTLAYDSKQNYETLAYTEFNATTAMIDKEGFGYVNEEALRKMYAESTVTAAEIANKDYGKTTPDMVAAYQKAVKTLSNQFSSHRKLIQDYTAALQKHTILLKREKQQYRFARQQAETLEKSAKYLNKTSFSRLTAAKKVLGEIPEIYIGEKETACIKRVNDKLAQFKVTAKQGKKRDREEAKPSTTIGTTFSSKQAEPKKAKQEAAKEYDTVHMQLRSGRTL